MLNARSVNAGGVHNRKPSIKRQKGLHEQYSIADNLQQTRKLFKREILEADVHCSIEHEKCRAESRECASRVDRFPFIMQSECECN